jgi:phosphomannomutase
VFDVKCSQRLAPAIRAAGGKPLMFKTGHSLIKAKMKEMRLAAGRRDERPHLLQGALVRL